MTHLLFAYGSNMDLDELGDFLEDHGVARGALQLVGPAALPHWELVWNYKSRRRAGGAANVAPAHGQEVPGVALRLDDDALRIVDLKEGRPAYYERELLEVRLATGEIVAAWVYVVVPERRLGATLWPSRGYRDLLVKAARAHGLPDWHVTALECTPACEDGEDEAELEHES